MVLLPGSKSCVVGILSPLLPAPPGHDKLASSLASTHEPLLPAHTRALKLSTSLLQRLAGILLHALDEL